MSNIIIEQFPCWPYDEASLWMKEKQGLVAKQKELIFVALGSHQEKVITLGKNLAKSVVHEKNKKFIYRQVERGGGATVHGPGQIVCYPVFNLSFHKLSVRVLVTVLENAMLGFIARLGLSARTDESGPGIFIGDYKVGFIGLRISTGISSHGFALNLFNDPSDFHFIDPCGISGLKVSSLHLLTKLDQPLDAYLDLMAGQIIEEISRLMDLGDNNKLLERP